MYTHGTKLYCINNKTIYRSSRVAADSLSITPSYLRDIVKRSSIGIVCIKNVYFIIVKPYMNDETYFTDEVISNFMNIFMKHSIE